MINEKEEKIEIGAISILMFIIEISIIFTFYLTQSRYTILFACFTIIELIGIATGIIGVKNKKYRTDLAIKGLIMNSIFPIIFFIIMTVVFIKLRNQPF